MVKSTPSLVLSRIVLLVGTMLVIAGCSDSTPARPTPTIEIVSSDWTGWQKQQPEPTRTAVTAERGKSFEVDQLGGDRKSTRLNSSHVSISYAVFCLKKTPRHYRF